jgi:ATP-binding cassette subfamily B protein
VANKETDAATAQNQSQTQRQAVPNPGFGGARPGAPVQKAKNFKDTFKRLLTYLKPQMPAFIIIIFMSILSTLFSIFAPDLTGQIIDKLRDAISYSLSPAATGTILIFTVVMQELIGLFLIMLGLYVLSALFSFVSQFVVSSLSQKIVYNMRKQVKDKLDMLPLKYFDGRTYGETLSRVTNDIDTISTTLQQSITQIVGAIITLLGILIIMFFKSWQLTLVILATLPVSAVIIILITKNSQKFFKTQSSDLGKLNGNVEEIYNAHKIVKAYSQEESSKAKFDALNENLRKSGYQSHFVSGIIFPAIRFVGNLGYVAVVVVGAILLADSGSGMTIGVMSAFMIYVNMFLQPVQQIAQISNIIQSTVASAERVFEILAEETERSDTTGASSIDLTAVKGRVEFKNVDFGYAPDEPLIRDMNLSISPGDSIAIVGPTGAGKTTLVNLLLRFYEITGGSIEIDGVDIKTIKRRELRSQFGMVLQDTWLFKGSVKDNIKYGKPDATDEEVVAAAKQAHTHHFITTLENGYDTVLNEDASNISNGQRQLITIARALLKNPKILILDEATSSVDTRTEQYIQTAMTALIKDRTSFVIAHRLSTIKNAAVILVMNKGRVIEQGSHKQLLDKGGFYADLYNSQFADHGEE